MPDPNSVSPGYNSGHVDLSAAPGVDQDWDSLFPNPESQTALAPQAPQGTPPQAQPQADQVFLKAGDTVYKTAEDAINGTTHKDQLIAKYRSYLADNGVDPNTFQRVQQIQSQTESIKPTSQYKYYGNPDFFDEVAAAATAKDRTRYSQLMDAHTQEAIKANLDPWRTTLISTNRLNALRQTETEIPGFSKFYGSQDYQKVLDNVPIFKDVIQICENDPNAAPRLHEAYKSVFLTYQGMNQTQTQPNTSAVSPNIPTVQQRSTLQPSALTPPPPSASTQGWQDNNWHGNKNTGNDARKQLIQDGDTRYRGMRFEDVGL